MLYRLAEMEQESNAPPGCSTFRWRTGLTCAAEFRGMRNGRTEDAITTWLAEAFSNAESQVTDIGSKRPDIVLAYERDEWGDDVFVFVEAKPIWQRWITTGEQIYAGVETDSTGRCTGNYCNRCIRQLADDRGKLLAEYTDSRDRLMLLALVFQRPGEVDAGVVHAVGPGWNHQSRHIADLCNPEGDDIGMTAMVFWPDVSATQTSTIIRAAGC